ncbi:RNA polymerase sigma factor [Echinicola sp. 20G]|uniref:RNA polymerase sigma factor n=1 Tax=Echinicola sp. 20G TaxID=2781961 RepID=UPI00190FC003|nr:sigma-70 family RNA polymerase sigma factor [Echinicola sp. 20G]
MNKPIANKCVVINHDTAPVNEFELTQRVEEPTDNQLWESILKGSDEALASLYSRYANKLYNYGTQITLDKDLAFDVVQDVFMYIVSKKLGLKKIESIKNYLYASYRRRLLRLMKRNRKIQLNGEYHRSDGFMVEMDESFYALSTPLTIDVKKMLEKICNDLPVRQREVITLYFFEELSYQEVAEIMDMSHVRSARNLLYKAIANMQKALKGKEDLIFALSLVFPLHQ